MRNNKYVLLTGSINNAGDYLIKYRAKNLLSQLRPDRDLVDMDRWKPLTEEQLETINSSKALILTGGPGLRPNMYPEIYPLTSNLNDIKVPILTLGLGYRDANGDWWNIANSKYSQPTQKLLHRINESGYLSGVRDYNTLNSLRFSGFKNFIMTGCPALYDLNLINQQLRIESLNTISFSLGVSYSYNKHFFTSMSKVITELKNFFHNKDFRVLFHHKINRDEQWQNEMIKMLEFQKINFIDISGSEKLLREEYDKTDLHIGYRVHAHIYMCSISKPSILISEDGRGKALFQVLGGVLMDSYYISSFGQWLSGKFGNSKGISLSRKPVENLEKHLIENLDYEIKHNYPRLRPIRNNILNYYSDMKKYIDQLP